MEIEKLSSSHDLEGFDCGEASLNEYLKTRARTHLKQNFGTTYVAIEEGNVIGYYTISSLSVKPEEFPHSVPKLEIGAILLGRLAIATDRQNQGLGKLLLFDALKKALESTKIVASHAVIVDALDQKAKSYYMKFGFVPLQDQDLRLFLSMKKIAKVIEA